MATKRKKKKKFEFSKKYIIILVAILIVVASLFSYAYFFIFKEQDDLSLLGTKCFDIDFVGENDISLQDQYPTSNEDGMNLVPYTFTITNTCDYTASYQVNLEVKSLENRLSLNYLKTAIDDEYKVLSDYLEVTSTLDNYDKSFTLKEGTLAKSKSVTHELRIWMDKDTPAEEGASKQIATKVVIIASPIKTEEPKLQGITAVLFKNSRVFSEVIPNYQEVTSEEDSGIYETEDDDGVSYYFRGRRELLNNNVIFAGFQWKIIRVNGDGSIRLIYNGTCPNNQCTINTTGSNTNATTSSFSSYSQSGKLGYVTTNNQASDIKNANDTWFNQNLISYNDYLADTLFCSDISVYQDLGNGFRYGAYGRLYVNNNPTLKCLDENSRYTVENGKLQYKVGLITADEAILAGGVFGVSNQNYYLYNNTYIYTMTPFYQETYPDTVAIKDDGMVKNDWNYTPTFGVRPVINIKNDIIPVSGDGSSSSPYIIE